MQQLCEMYGCMDLPKPGPHHTTLRGMEHANVLIKTLEGLLSSLDLQNQPRWHTKLPKLLQASRNNSTHVSTELTPHYVLFGQYARLPVDMVDQVTLPQPSYTLEGWVKSHYHALREAFAKVKMQTERHRA